MKLSKSFLLIPIAALVALAAVGAASGADLTHQAAPTAKTQPAPSYQTMTARLGDLSTSISGTGSTTPSNSIALAFPTSGTVASVNVQVGDTVKAGQALATLEGIDQLQQAVNNNQIALQNAQDQLDALLNGKDVALDQALSAEWSAQATLTAAQSKLVSKSDPSCTSSTYMKYYNDYSLYAKQAAALQDQLDNPKPGDNRNYLLSQLSSVRQKRDVASENLQYCSGYSDQAVTASQATLQLAQAQYNQAQQSYQTLQANGGIDPAQLQIDQAALQSARLALAKSQDDLRGATLVAPIDGTVLAVNGSAGQNSGTGAFITLADLSHPLVQVNMDETDLDGFQVGCQAVVTFTAIPGKTFNGTVTQISPQLVAVKNVEYAQGWVELKDTLPQNGIPNPTGMSASVDVNCTPAKNVLVIPMIALHQDTNSGQAYVFILNASGQPEKRAVSVGIQTSESVEVTSGLNAGDRVITSNVKIP